MAASLLLWSLVILPAQGEHFIFSQRLRAGMAQPRESSSMRAIPGPSSANKSPGSFVVQMPFTVLSNENSMKDLLDRDQQRPQPDAMNDQSPTLVSLGGNGEKINFYTIKCRRGEPCSSIIPAQVVPEPVPQNKRTEEEIKQYLKDHNLSNGFGFSKNSEKPDLAARYFENDKKEQENKRDSRQFNFKDFGEYDYDDYWPGSHLRPGRKQNHKDNSGDTLSSNPFGGRQFQGASSLSSLASSWPKGVHILATPNFFPSRADSGRKYSPQIPSPTFGNALEWPYSYSNNGHNTGRGPSGSDRHVSHSIKINPYSDRKRHTTQKPVYNTKPKRDGEWRRFSKSTVTQLDKDSGKWNKVSSNSNKVSSTSNEVSSYNTYKKPSVGSTYNPPTVFHFQRPQPEVQGTSYRPPVSSTTLQHTSTGLTVMGVTETNSVTSSNSPTETSSSYFPGYFPTRPWGTSRPGVYPLNPRPSNDSKETPKPLIPVSASTHVSYPLYVLPADPSSTPLSVEDPGIALAAAAAQLTPVPSTTTTPVRTTRATTRRTTTTTTTTPKPAGGGGGGGGFLGNNPYAVMAAVGAGLIPATFAALLPVFVGRRRRRRSLDVVEDEGRTAPAPAFLLELPQSLRSSDARRLRRRFNR